ncbi:MAG: hypothetical protein JEZ14_25875 [Marinilabiliaceae bacterium]|nr:hypothetical protein [Marinilabiliaceae bacterium]
MKKEIIINLTFCFALSLVTAWGQKSVPENHLQNLPNNWSLQINHPISYLVTTTHYDYSMMGPFLNKTQITGQYTRTSEDGTVRWNQVEIAQAHDLEASFDTGLPQPVMEGFSYVPSEKMMEAANYSDFPQDATGHLFRNLVWDMMGFEFFAWALPDSYPLNLEYRPVEANYKIELAGEGTFENKDIRLTWIGTTQKNNQPCVIIKFSVMNNPLSMHSEHMKLKGRSHYWGNIYVALNSKQIEYAELYEDVIMNLKMTGQDESQRLNTVRTIFAEKITK